MITNAFQGRDASKLPSYQGLLQVPYTILSVSASIFRTEGVTVGGLSLAASYMAQVEHMLWLLEALNFSISTTAGGGVLGRLRSSTPSPRGT